MKSVERGRDRSGKVFKRGRRDAEVERCGQEGWQRWKGVETGKEGRRGGKVLKEGGGTEVERYVNEETGTQRRKGVKRGEAEVERTHTWKGVEKGGRRRKVWKRGGRDA